MKKKTSKTNIETCEWIVNCGDCDGDCEGNCFPSDPCPLNAKDKYNCSNFDTAVFAAKKFIEDHIADEEEEKEETTAPMSVEEAKDKGLIKSGWFWDDNPELAEFGLLIKESNHVWESKQSYKGLLTLGVGKVEWFDNFSETKPDDWVEINVE